ncbi:cytochrome P450 [Ponticaulis profundi]|uniref:Cytochrome P450 n=1 Tax=Ponticaulis profundi TaxID=2665222 RepID=A0ABW1SD99_9PROT
MADTTTEVPKVVENSRYERLPDGRLQENHIRHGGPIPPASAIDLETLDITDPELWRRNEIWGRFERMRNEDPVHYCPESPVGPYWSITRYDDIMAIDTDHKRFSSDAYKGGITLFDMDDDFVMPMFIAMDQPKHDVQRKTVQPIVGPDNLKNFEKLIRERTQYVLDRMPVNEPFDWVDNVSIELTTMMLATLFDFPFEDRRKLTRWSDVATGRENPEICPGGEEQWRTELLECLGYFTELWNERVNLNEPGNDLISMLAHGEHTRNMEPMEYLGNVILLIVGGNDTTRNSMSASVYGMNLFPKEFQKLKDNHDLLPSMVSEIIRWQTPLAHMRRTAVEDVEMHGKTIKAGDKVAMWYASGNRDERHFERPNDIWIDRPKVRSHLSFGFGIHRCVGNRLGELQLKILWEEFFKRFSDVIVLEEPGRTQGSFVKGYTKMMVQLVPK